MTDDLIARLSDDLKPVPANAVLRRLALAAAAGVFLSAVIMVAWLGIRPDLGIAIGTPNFWVKFGYTLALGLLGVWAASRIARPGETGSLPLGIGAVVVSVMGAASAVDYMLALPEDRRALVMGGSALVCPFYILALSVPLLLAAMAFMRRMAPTNLALGGLAAGLMAGALGAWVYSFHCTEQGLPFLALWYSLGIVAVMATGAIAGRWALRW